jgi:hypothetical protein
MEPVPEELSGDITIPGVAPLGEDSGYGDSFVGEKDVSPAQPRVPSAGTSHSKRRVVPVLDTGKTSKARPQSAPMDRFELPISRPVALKTVASNKTNRPSTAKRRTGTGSSNKVARPSSGRNHPDGAIPKSPYSVPGSKLRPSSASLTPRTPRKRDVVPKDLDATTLYAETQRLRSELSISRKKQLELEKKLSHHDVYAVERERTVTEELRRFAATSGSTVFEKQFQQSSLTTSMRRRIKELESERDEALQELAELKNSMKATRMQELESENRLFRTDCLRLQDELANIAAENDLLHVEVSRLQDVEAIWRAERLEAKKAAKQKKLQSAMSQHSPISDRVESNSPEKGGYNKGKVLSFNS